MRFLQTICLRENSLLFPLLFLRAGILSQGEVPGSTCFLWGTMAKEAVSCWLLRLAVQPLSPQLPHILLILAEKGSC